jgi:homoserine kinase type II
MWPKKIAVAHCAQVGEALARMHLAGADFELRRPNALSLAGWAPLFDGSRERAHEVQRGLAEELSGELAALSAGWPKSLPDGVIHADLFPDNVFFLDDKLSGMIDFYFACNDFLAYDLGVCLNAWCFEKDGSLNATKARALVQGYRKTREITKDEIEALPILARGSALRFLLTRLYDWLHHPAGAFVQPKDPLEYLKKLRFHRQVKSAAAYGL